MDLLQRLNTNSQPRPQPGESLGDPSSSHRLHGAGFLLAAATAPAQAGIFDRGKKGNGDLTTKTYDLDDCHAVLLECGLDIELTFGKSQRVALTMDENLLKYYELDERDGTLVVDADKNPRPSRGARLELTLRSLDQLEIDGAGDIEVTDFDGEELRIEIQGAGDVRPAAEVVNLYVEIDGAGDIDARDLKADNAEVTVNGAGDVSVYASVSCDVTINGVGDVDVYGKPEKFHKDVNGIGDVDRK